MTLGRHRAWRRLAAELADGVGEGPALDVATGTGDLAFALARRPHPRALVGVDFTDAMLAVARGKRRRLHLERQVAFLKGDAHRLPFRGGAFASATVGFGLRNFVDVSRALREMARVVRPGGLVVVLEIVPVGAGGPLARLAWALFRRGAPWLGALLARDREAYRYLPESVDGFLTAPELARMMRDAGLTNVVSRRLALGAVALIVGEKVEGNRAGSFA